MLLRANFIPERLAERRRRRRYARWGLWLTLLLGVGMLLPAFALQELTSRRAAALLAVRSEREQSAEQVAEAVWLEGELSRLAEARAVARAAHTNNALWQDLLEELRDRMPEGLWLTYLQIAEPAQSEFDYGAGVSPADRLRPEAGERMVVLRGRAERHQAIGEYLQALNHSPWLKTAELVASGPDLPVDPAGDRVEAEPNADAEAADVTEDAALDPNDGTIGFEFRAVLRRELPTRLGEAP